MSRLRAALSRLFYGRNGVDDLCRFLLYICLFLMFCGVFIRNPIFYYIELALVTLALLRSLSKNAAARSRENAVYVKVRGKLSQFFLRQINRIRYHSTKVYKRCPYCKSHLCLPRKKGRHTVKCPVCSAHFDIKI